MNKLYVGNLPFSTSEDALSTLFSQYGEITSVNLIKDRETGRPRGFGFVEFADQSHAEAALALNGYELEGRALKVNIAQARRSGGAGGGRGGDRGDRRW